MPGLDDAASVPCDDSSCAADADFRFYDRPAGAWRPLCERHALEIHPSLEIHALLESGYLRPVEVGVLEGPPGEPRTGRAVAFRREVEATLGWDE